MAQPTQQAQVMSVRPLSPTVRQLVFSPLERKISFRPGQWVSLQLPVGAHPPLVRAYSMAEPEAPSGQLVLAFDHVPKGLGSGYLFTLKEGDRVVLSGPYGNFVVPEPLSQDLIFVARYTGIVPIRCMIKHLFGGALSTKVTLLYGGPSRAELIYHDEFTELASQHNSFRYVATVLDGRQESDCEHRPEIELLSSLLGGRKDILPMICGTKAFVRPLRAYLTEFGFERREIRVETYD